MAQPLNHTRPILFSPFLTRISVLRLPFIPVQPTLAYTVEYSSITGLLRGTVTKSDEEEAGLKQTSSLAERTHTQLLS